MGSTDSTLLPHPPHVLHQDRVDYNLSTGRASENSICCQVIRFVFSDSDISSVVVVPLFQITYEKSSSSSKHLGRKELQPADEAGHLCARQLLSVHDLSDKDLELNLPVISVACLDNIALRLCRQIQPSAPAWARFL